MDTLRLHYAIYVCKYNPKNLLKFRFSSFSVFSISLGFLYTNLKKFIYLIIINSWRNILNSKRKKVGQDYKIGMRISLA